MPTASLTTDTRLNGVDIQSSSKWHTSNADTDDMNAGYCPHLAIYETIHSPDWVEELELSRVEAFSRAKMARPPRILVLYGSLRQRWVSIVIS